VTVSHESSGAVATFASAAHSFAAVVHDIPADQWDGPGLGEWDLRALVGHASRSLITVSTYLSHAAEREDVTSPQDYYAQIREYASKVGAALTWTPSVVRSKWLLASLIVTTIGLLRAPS